MSTSEDRILRRPEVESLTGLARSTIYMHLNQGSFPRPVRLGPRAVGWRHSDLMHWLATRETTSDAGEKSFQNETST